MRHVCVSTNALWASHPRLRFKDVNFRASGNMDRVTGRGILCFYFVRSCSHSRTGAVDSQTSGWLRSWDRSIKYTGEAASTSGKLRASGQKKGQKGGLRSTPAPSGVSSIDDEGSTCENFSTPHPDGEHGHEPSRASEQTSDFMLQTAGQDSWESVEVVPKRTGGNCGKEGRLKKSKLTPPRKRQRTRVPSQNVGEGGLYLMTARAGVVQEGVTNCDNRLIHTESWGSKETTTQSAAKTKVVKTTSSKLTGGLISKIAVKIMRADGAVFMIRKLGAKWSHAVNEERHAGEWQLPSAPLNQNTTPLAAMLNLCRGLLRPRPANSGKSLVWEPSSFICGKRLGRPQLVLIYEAVVSEDDIHPARASLRKQDYMWASAAEYSRKEQQMSEAITQFPECCLASSIDLVQMAPSNDALAHAAIFMILTLMALMKRSPWRIVWLNKRGRFTARPQLQGATGPEMRAFSEEEKEGELDHGYITLALQKDALRFRPFTQSRLLHVVCTAVWDKKEKKVLIASRWHRIDKQGRAIGRKAKSPVSGKNKQYEERWEFPGGKVEAGETHVQAAVREMKEEMNLRICEDDLYPASFQTFPWYSNSLVRLLFTTDKFTGKVKSECEAQNFKWVGLDELNEFEFMNSDTSFAEWVKQYYGEQI